MGEHIPRFSSREEEAEFWQRMSLDALSADELEAVEVERPQRPLSATFAVRFDPRTVELLRRIAKSEGLGPTQLVRRWVLERLALERKAGVLAERRTEYPAELELTMRKTIIERFLAELPGAVDAAMQEVLDHADQAVADLRDS